ncbi:transglycosylase domain-containing protein [Salimicrobium flavidum]|uniref:Penicillin-binding protein 1A n=1 Tax=Salimicrobium flavidum TaxID=570947 RepID=A0A1N7IJH6_9BACI|nr:PBP1A family penicillin-binding protein [Salimicrobium flavidum]SIS37217.1 penicillin-binding protein 1A [Salimicrobium flavidum]
MSKEYNSRKERREQSSQAKKETKGTKGKKKATNKQPSKLKKILSILLIAGLLLGLGGAGMFIYYASNAPELKASELTSPFSSKVYDMNDELVTDLAGEERRSQVSYGDLPQKYVDSVLATEDVRFFEHSGVDPKRILAAIWANITQGFGSEGASTITQQVIKQSLLTSDKTIERKVQEQYLAFKLDREYSKEEIFEMYVNKIYFGQGAYGVAEAAETYFNKTDLDNLTLAESALLAGLPQRPSGYDPYENPDLAKDRMNTVLHLMVDHGKISEAEAEEARQTEISSMLAEQTEETRQYQAFIDRVKKEVESQMGDVDIFKDGLKIYTTLDPEAQELTEQSLSSDGGPISWPNEDLQTAVTVTDTQTGAIRAIGGGRDYVSGGLNYASDDPRQAGSTMKPIAAYGPAIEFEQWSTYHQLQDEPIEFGDWNPTNWDDRYRGWMTMREALADSINIPAIKTLDEIGTDRASEFAEKLGISFGEDGMVLSDAIGSEEVTPIQMAGAFAAFGNEGVYNEPYTVRKVETPENGTVDFTPEPVSAMKDYTAYMITSMLETVVTEGTGTAADVPGVPVAGKTGTTNEEVDSWFNGYSTNYSISVWTGNQDRSPIQSGKDIPKQMFRHLMGELSQDVETEDFSRPESAVWVDVEAGSRPAKLPSAYTPSSRIVTELFQVDNQPSNVSSQFQRMDPVSNLAATYSESSDSINVSWSYSESAQFSVYANGSTLSNTEQTSLQISNPQPGRTYDITVVASGSGGSSDSEGRSVSVQVPGEEPSSGEDEENQESNEGENEQEQENDENNNGESGTDQENNSGEQNNNSDGENGNGNSGNQNNGSSENEGGSSGNQNNDSEQQNNDQDNGSNQQSNDQNNDTEQQSNDENDQVEQQSSDSSGNSSSEGGSGSSEDSDESNDSTDQQNQ